MRFSDRPRLYTPSLYLSSLELKAREAVERPTNVTEFGPRPSRDRGLRDRWLEVQFQVHGDPRVMSRAIEGMSPALSPSEALDLLVAELRQSGSFE